MSNAEDIIEDNNMSTKSVKAAMERAAMEFDGILKLIPEDERQYFILRAGGRIEKLYKETLEELQSLKNVLEELQIEKSKYI